MENNFDCVVIGAGAAGLMAAQQLAATGASVCILEAADAAGGRIATTRTGFSSTAERGAEFIHPPAPLTMQILNEAGIEYKTVKGKMINVINGRWQRNIEEDEDWEQLMIEIDKLETDITISQFLQEYFSAPEFEELRLRVKRFAEGYDLADINNASILSIKQEWQQEEEDTYRIGGGYSRLIDYLLRQCNQNRVSIRYRQPVQTINYSDSNVEVISLTGEILYTSKVIVAVSLGVLQAGDITFLPELSQHKNALDQLGFGAVVKILLEFKNPFWKAYDDDIGFIFSNEEIPTWWTQSPVHGNLLTGWLGGPQARKKSGNTTENILTLSLLSLSSIFKIPTETLFNHLSHYKIECWQNQQYTKGGYSYNTIYSSAAKIILEEPVNDAIFFAGEAMYNGQSQGTVEAALQSGKITAERVKKSLRHTVASSATH